MKKVHCFNCDRPFERCQYELARSKRHFCSRSCSVATNNRESPKRKKTVRAKQKPEIRCITCDTIVPNVTKARKYCDDCSKARNIQRTSEYRRSQKKKAVEYLGGKCSACGYSKSVWAMDFHHKDPNQKDFAIGSRNLSLNKIIKELDKCVLLCANCHRELHSQE